MGNRHASDEVKPNAPGDEQEPTADWNPDNNEEQLPPGPGPQAIELEDLLRALEEKNHREHEEPPVQVDEDQPLQHDGGQPGPGEQEQLAPHQNHPNTPYDESQNISYDQNQNILHNQKLSAPDGGKGPAPNNEEAKVQGKQTTADE